MGRSIQSITAAAVMLFGSAITAHAQDSQGQNQDENTSGQGRVITPESNIEHAGDAGVRAHTNVRLFMPTGGQPLIGPPVAGSHYDTPGSIACLYRLVVVTAGCNPNTALAVPTGGSKAIAIVDAYDYPEAASDLANFSAQFGLPFTSSNFQTVFAAGFRPPPDPSGGWELEEALDIEWAHAMAPNAKIFLVEAASNSLSDLLQAESVASLLVAAAGGGEVSNSWGGSEFSTETSLDSAFTTSGVAYFASSGDTPGTSWPGVSPNVVSVGGTTISRNASTGDFQHENTWAEAGAGKSRYESRPTFQNGVMNIVGTKRGVPDVSADANPTTGVYVLDTHQFQGGPGGWFVVGGTSLASPLVAGIVNLAGHFANSSQAENSTIYLSGSAGFNDITDGDCDVYSSREASTGFDLCSGNGSPKGVSGK